MGVMVISDANLFAKLRAGLLDQTRKRPSFFGWQRKVRMPITAKLTSRSYRKPVPKSLAVAAKAARLLIKRDDMWKIATFKATKMLLKKGVGAIADGKRRLRIFRQKCKGLHNLREALYDCLRYPDNQKMKVRLHRAANVNAAILRNTQDSVLRYLLDSSLDPNIVPASRVKKWLRASPKARKLINFDQKVLRLVDTRPIIRVPVAQQVVYEELYPETDTIPMVSVKPKIKIFDDVNQLHPIDWAGTATCNTQAQEIAIKRNLKERMAFAIQNGLVKYTNIIKKYLSVTGQIITIVMPRLASCQADNEDAHGDGTVQQDQSQNVIITTARETSGERVPRIGNWVGAVTEDTVGSFPELVERWNPIKTIIWSANNARGSLLYEMNLPVDAVHDEGNRGLVTYIPFASHEFWTGDMKIRVDLNVNKFTVGQLQVAFYYGWNYDDNRNLRKNIKMLSQCQHGILDAGACNSVELIIPFKHQSVMVSTRTRNGVDPLYVGTLMVHVLAPLRVPDGQSRQCSVITYMSLQNCSFTGQISRKLNATPQMESALVIAGAMKLLDTVSSDFNRDNPPAIIPPNYIVPTASHSWCAGTNLVDQLHMLRLDPAAQTHHPRGIDAEQFDSVSQLCGIFSLYDNFTWGTNNVHGSQLWGKIVSPCQYDGTLNGEDLSVLPLSPLEVITSLFAQWRGTIEYRFDFVASQFHTGRIMIAFVPNAGIISTPIDLNMAKSSYNVVFDLHEQRSITFQAPYVGVDPWTRRRHNMSGSNVDYCSTGRIVILVMCPLSVNDTVSQTIDVNVYIRGGSSYELSVPVQPNLGLASNTKILTFDMNDIPPSPGMDPVYLGTWDGYFGNDELVLRWGVLAGRVAEFPKAAFWDKPEHAKTAIYFQSNMNVGYWDQLRPATQRVCSNFIVIHIDNIYAAFAFASSRDAARAWRLFMAGDEMWKENIIRGSAGAFTAPGFTLRRRQLVRRVQMERMNTVDTVSPLRPLISTNFGRDLYGEQFLRLKDLCRRYQLYGSRTVTPKRLSYFALCKFPANPAGLDLDLGTTHAPNYVSNKCREGLIPLLFSGFKFFRGSLRFRITVPPSLGSQVWVQHRPEMFELDNCIADATSDDDELCMLAHGYAMYLQHTFVNGILEFEVPFYQTGKYGILSRSKIDGILPYTNLGAIVLGVPGLEKLPGDVKIDVYYSIADDFNFNTFQGFMPCIDLTQISVAPDNAARDSADWGLVPRTGTAQSLTSWLLKNTAHEIKPMVQQKIDEVANGVKQAIDEATEAIENGEMARENKLLLCNTVTNIAHVANAPSMRGVCIAVISILASIGIKLIDYLEVGVKFFTHVWEKFTRLNSEVLPVHSATLTKNDVKTDDHRIQWSGGISLRRGKSQSDEDESIVAQWISCIYAAICVSFGIKNATSSTKPPFEKWSAFLTKDIANCAKGGTAIVRFIEVHFTVLRKIVDWIVYQFCPDSKILGLFSGKSPKIKYWMEEALNLTNMENRSANFNEDIWLERLTACELVGREIMVSLTDSDRRNKSSSSATVERYYGKVQRVLIDAVNRGRYPYLRCKPLHIQIHGQPGIGKSSIIKSLARHVLRNTMLETVTSPNFICHVSGSDRFWNQCDGKQPVVVIDDLWAVQTPNILEAQLCTYFELYGDCAFSPPMASVDDKKMRYAPKLMITTTNKPQIIINNVDEVALKRRRDVLVEVVAAPLDPEGHPLCQHCKGSDLGLVPAAMLEDNHHILFYFNKIQGVSDVTDRIGGPFSYSEFLTILDAKLKPIWEKNKAAYRQEVGRLTTTNPFDDYGTIDERLARDALRMRDMHMTRYTRIYDSILSFGEGVKARLERACGLRCTPDYSKYVSDGMSLIDDFCHATGNMRDATSQADEEQIIITPVLKKDWQDSLQRIVFNNQIVCSREQFDKLPGIIILHHALGKYYESFVDTIVGGNIDVANAVISMAHQFLLRENRGNGDELSPEYMCNRLLDFTKCKHSSTLFFDTVYASGIFMGGEDVYCTDEERCKNCLLDTPLAGLVMDCWESTSSIKTAHLSNGNEARIPKYYRMNTSNSIETIVESNFKKMFQDFKLSIAKQLEPDSLFMRILSRAQKIAQKIYSLVSNFATILAPFLVLWGLYAGAKHSTKKYYAAYSGEIADFEREHRHRTAMAREQTEKWSLTLPQAMSVPEKKRLMDLQFDEYMNLARPPLPIYTPPVASPEAKVYGNTVQRVGKSKIPQIARSEAHCSQQADVVEKRIRMNSCYIRVTYIDDFNQIRTNKFMCLMLYNRYLLMQRHYVETIDQVIDKATVRFSWVENRERIANAGEDGVEIDFKYCKRFYYEYEPGKRDSNFVRIALPCHINQVKDITKFIAKQSQHAHVSKSVLFVRPGNSTHQIPLRVDYDGITIAGLNDNRYSGDIHLDMTYEYKMSSPGYCGSIIMDPSLERPIIGMHVAGLDGTEYGIAELMVGETFQPTLSLREPVIDKCEMQLDDIDLSQLDIDTIIYPQGIVAPKLAASQSPETQYTKSVFAGQLMPITTEPMPLSIRDPRMCGKDPLVLGCSKHGLRSHQFDPKTIEFARQHYGEKLITLVKPIRRNVSKLTLEQAIVGDPDIEQFTPMEWSTSEGFPLVKLRPTGAKGKRWLFDLRENQHGYELLNIHPVLKSLLSKEYTLRKNGIRPDTVYIDCLKDEVRDIEKARTPGKTRVFSTSPIQYLIAYKQYYGDFLASIRTHRIESEHAIGINVDGIEWTRLAKYLQHYGSNVVAGDYSHFGYTLNADIMQACFQIMLDWYAKYDTSDTFEEDQIIRSVIAAEAVNVKRLARNVIYESMCGMASGFPATDVLNTMVNSMYVRCAWIEHIKEPLYEFDMNVNLVTYGDDLAMNVSPKYLERFNTITLGDYFKSKNIRFTDIDKSGKMIAYRDFSETPFLKRIFVKHPTRPGLYLAKIDEQSIGSALNWIHKRDDPLTATIVNMRAALNLSYGHGPEYYDVLLKRIKQKLSTVNVNFPALTWHEYDGRIYDAQ